MNADFEKQLQRQPLRELPRDWRAEILDAATPRPAGFLASIFPASWVARATRPSRRATGPAEGRMRILPKELGHDPSSPLSGPVGESPTGTGGSPVPPNQRAMSGLRRGEEVSAWPSLRAWAALGAVWIVIFLFHLTAPDEPRLARGSSPMTLQSFAKLHEQTLIMAQLLGQTEPTDAGEPPAALPAAPRPRSEIARKQLIG